MSGCRGIASCAAFVVLAGSLIIAGAGCEQYFGHSHPGGLEPDARIGGGSGSGAGPGTGPGYMDAGTDAATPPLGPVRTLAKGLDTPTQVVLDDDELYWVNTSSRGSVMRVAKAGGLPQILAADQVFPVSLVVDASDVYWTTAGIGAGTGQVMRVAKTGGAPAAVVGGLNWPADLAGDSDYLYWRDDRKGLQRIAKRGGTEPELLVASQTLSGAVAIDDTRVYFNEVSGSGGPGTIRAVAKAGGPVADVASLPNWFIPTLVIDGSDVYWHNGGVDSLWHALASGGVTPTAVFGGGFEMRYIAATRNALFITEMGEPFAPGAVHQIPRAGGCDRLVTPRGVGLWGIAVDDSTIYWTNISDGTLSAIAR
jgi:hypothetical protein